MSISDDLKRTLQQVLSGNPWYGSPVYTIIDNVSFEAAFKKPQGSAHNIAGIVLHIIAWTEEVIDRLNGMAAQQPSSGDWPDPATPDEQKWQNYVNDFKLVNVNLLSTIENLPDGYWCNLVNGTVENDPGTTYEALVRGLIQHHIYHAAQIALLNRMING